MGERVLVVDDNALNRRLFEVLLVAEGYQVVLVKDAPSALAAIDREAPGAVLMDLRLPGVDGLELTRQLKAAPDTARIPIIAVTASAMRADEDEARAAGCDGFVTKPIDIQILRRTLANLLGPNGAERR